MDLDRRIICFAFCVLVAIAGCATVSTIPPMRSGAIRQASRATLAESFDSFGYSNTESDSVAADLLSQAAAPPQTIYVVRHGWHTGIAVRHEDISPLDWPDGAALEGVQFVEVGWGDAGFYQASAMWPWVVANAAFLPSRSALHVAGIIQPLDEFFPQSQIIEIDVTHEQMGRLCRFIRDSCMLDDHQVGRYLGPALYGIGGFLAGREKYFVPKTCNTWTARALAAAECPIFVPCCTLAPGIVIQSRMFGRVVQEPSTVLPVLYPFFNFDRPNAY